MFSGVSFGNAGARRGLPRAGIRPPEGAPVDGSPLDGRGVGERQVVVVVVVMVVPDAAGWVRS